VSLNSENEEDNEEPERKELNTQGLKVEKVRIVPMRKLLEKNQESEENTESE